MTEQTEQTEQTNKLTAKQKRDANQRAFEAARFANKLRAANGEQQITEFNPPHPETWAKRLAGR